MATELFQVLSPHQSWERRIYCHRLVREAHRPVLPFFCVCFVYVTSGFWLAYLIPTIVLVESYKNDICQ